MGVVFVLLGFVTLFACIFAFFQNLRKMRLEIPAPFVLPIIGHAHLIVGLNNEGEGSNQQKQNCSNILKIT